MTDGAEGVSSIVMPNALLISSRSFVCKVTAADSTWLAAPAVSVATTVRITLPASTVTVSMHAGGKHRSSWRKLALMASAFASYSSTVPAAFSTKVTFLADTISVVAAAGKGGGLGGGSRRRREPQSLQSVPKSHIELKASQPPSWQIPSPAVPQVSMQIMGGGDRGGGEGEGGGGGEGDGGGGGGGDGGGK